ncbi:30S ribosomal protein S9 [Candidatus Woesearchaeota archaeon]|nr:30S ribosomal protein S9 [Candidatus Woesearchaeota archaeon]
MKIVSASGKRKRAIARVTLRQGKGIIRINNALLENYSPELSKMKIMEPILLAGDSAGKVDIDVSVSGGGVTSQAEASRLGIAKGLSEFSKSDKLKKAFLEYDRSLLVADVRRKETRKPNRHGKARAKRQKSYR